MTMSFYQPRHHHLSLVNLGTARDAKPFADLDDLAIPDNDHSIGNGRTGGSINDLTFYSYYLFAVSRCSPSYEKGEYE